MKTCNEQTEVLDWNTVNNLVKPEHQYRDVVDLPVDAVRMAWPFKTEQEQEALRKWFKSQQRLRKQEEKERAIEIGAAFF